MTAGVYQRPTALTLTGTVTLDAQGDPAAVFIIQAGTLTAAANSRVLLTGGAQACNVFWQIASSATLGTDTAFVGDILALQSITLNTRATMLGRALARNGAVTLDTNTVDRQDCATIPGPGPGPGPAPGPGAPPPGAPGTAPGTPSGPGASPGSTPGAAPPGAVASSGPNGSALVLTVPRAVGRTITRFGTDRCVDGRFRVAVRGKFIRKVTFLVDGRRIGIQHKAPFSMLVRMHRGTHKLRAKVYFTDGTRVRNIRFRFRACTEQVRRTSPKPKFVG